MVKDIWLRIATPETVAGEIPRYLIIKDGAIVDFNAPHPSEYDQLVTKLTAFLK